MYKREDEKRGAHESCEMWKRDTTRSSEKQPEAASNSQKQPGAARSSQEQPGAKPSIWNMSATKLIGCNQRLTLQDIILGFG